MSCFPIDHVLLTSLLSSLVIFDPFIGHIPLP